MLKYTFIILFLIIPAQASSIVLLNSTTIQDMQDNINLITLSGAYISHRYPPNILIGDNISINLTNQKNIVLITSSLVNSSDYPNLSYIVLESWNKDIQIKLSPYKLAQSLSVPIEPIYNDVVNMMSQKSIQSNNNPDQSKIYGASFIDTSEYFIGDIAIGIIIPESNGSIDNNTLNWTTEQEINIINKIRNGLNWWISKEPNANITFTYDIHYRVPTSYEPTLRPSFSSLGQELWMTDAMTYLNYTNLSDYYGNIIDYDNYIRNNLSTDWAFTVFVVNGNHFIDNYFAYASLGGPFFVMTYSNNGYSINNMDAVTAHETGHIFYANDQYTSSNTPCSERTGYLNIENQNSEQSCISNVPSIMRGQVSPFTNNQIDTYARQQLGWSDTNNNSVLDILDFPPTTTISPYQNISNNAAPIFNILTTTTSTLPSLNPVSYSSRNPITINTIKIIQYKLNNYSWIPIYITNTTNSLLYQISLYNLSDGNYTLHIESQNTASVTNITQTIFTIDTISPVISFTVKNNSNSIDITINSSEPINSTILNWNGVNYSFNNLSINKTNLLSGTYTFKIYANDKANNWNSTSFTSIVLNSSISEHIQFISSLSSSPIPISISKSYKSSNPYTTIIITKSIEKHPIVTSIDYHPIDDVPPYPLIIFAISIIISAVLIIKRYLSDKANKDKTIQLTLINYK